MDSLEEEKGPGTEEGEEQPQTVSLSPIEEVKVMVGDIGQTPILTDDTYQYFLDKYSGSVKRASVDAAKTIMYFLTRMPTRERTGDIEVWNNWSRDYMAALKLFLKDAALNSFNPIAYAGGVSKRDMFSNDANSDNVRPRLYKGFSVGKREYNRRRNRLKDDSSY